MFRSPFNLNRWSFLFLMLPKTSLFFGAALLAGLSAAGMPAAYAQQSPSPVSKQAVMLRRVLDKYHYQPRPLNDSLSAHIFRRFLRMLDPRHLYFTAADVQQLSEYRTRLDEELWGKSWQFVPLVTKLYRQRLAAAETAVEAALQKPFDFSANESITFGGTDSLHFAAEEKEYAQRWQKWLKYQALVHLTRTPAGTNAAGTAPALTAKEPAVRQKLGQIEKRNIRRILDHPGGFEEYVGSLFLNAVTLCYDPHTNYLSKTDWQNYEGALSKEQLSFGVDLDETDEGAITISRLVPGGPAWKSNELHKGDVLLALKWSGKNSVDLAGADLEEVEEFLGSSNADRLEITVQKTNGMVKTVALLKEKIREEENVVKSFILNGDKKIGYISLPGFYTEWESRTGQGCANDVAKEIVKLQKEKVEGLILDIRHNGGGSLGEGVDLAGIFINEGPLCVLKGRAEKPEVLKDMNRGTVYDGPLVVLVNGQSASASEVLAGTLQDYNRAVIVGSQTFGKATGQIVVPLDSTISLTAPAERKARSPYGFVTVTIEKLYRVTGRSAQLKGVRPDIALPDVYDALDYREATYPFALSSDSLNRKFYFSPLGPLPVAELTRRSTGRLAGHPSFGAIRRFTEVLVKAPDKTGQPIPLQPAYFTQRGAENQRRQQELATALEQATTLYTVENTAYDRELMHMDAYDKEVNETLVQNVRSDIYITEGYQIAKDLILLQSSK
jgi:carboxyl-terminal processing protease